MSTYESIAAFAVNSWSLQERSGVYRDVQRGEDLTAVGGPNRDAFGPNWWLPRAVTLFGPVSLRRSMYVGSSGILGMTLCAWLRKVNIGPGLQSLYSYSNINLGMLGTTDTFAVFDNATLQSVPVLWSDQDWHFCAWRRSQIGNVFSVLFDDFQGSSATVAAFSVPADLSLSLAGQDLACDVAGVMVFNYPVPFADLQLLRRGPLPAVVRPRLRSSGKIRKIRG